MSDNEVLCFGKMILALVRLRSDREGDCNILQDKWWGLKNYYWSFLFWPHNLQHLSSLTRTKAWDWQWKHWVLATVSPGNSLFFFCFFFLIIYLVVSGLSCGMWDLSLWLEGSSLQHVGWSLDVACGVSCPTTFGILVPWPGILNMHCLHWKVDS